MMWSGHFFNNSTPIMRSPWILWMGIVVLSMPPVVTSQPLWELTYGSGEISQVHGDLSLSNLKNLVLSEKLYAAAVILAIEHGETEESFILTNMAVPAADLDEDPIGGLQYYHYALLQGYFGNPAARTAMEYIVSDWSDLLLRLSAVGRLAVAEDYDHLGIVTEGLADASLRDHAIRILGLYGRSSTHYNTALSIIENEVRTSSERVKRMNAARALAVFDRAKSIAILEDLFSNASGGLRYEYFEDLGRVDPDGQAVLSILGIQTELDPILRSDYLPEPTSVAHGFLSPEYFEPFYIKFVLDRTSIETIPSIIDELQAYLSLFEPIPPNSNTTPASIVENLITTLTEVGGYGWLTNSSFLSELNLHLATAKTALIGGLENTAAREILTFQKKVDHQYLAQDDGDDRMVTREGWKFLFFNARFALDRIPGLTTVTYTIPPEWRMISVPVDLGYFSKPYTFPAAVSDASAFNPTSGYVPSDPLWNGSGFWIKHDTQYEASQYGLDLTMTSVPVQPGWNLVGSLSQDITTSQIDPQGVVILSSYYGYAAGGYHPSTTLKKGEGYWVKVANAGNILLGGGSTPGNPPPQTPPPSPGAPPTPVLQVPAHGATNVPLATTLSWFPSYDASSYSVQVATDSFFIGLIVNQAGISSTSKSLSSLSHGTNYYWRVNAANQHGVSYWAAHRHFTTVPPPAPPAPSPVSPENLATDVSVSPTVSWSASNGATSYQIQVSTSPSFMPLIQNYSGWTMTSKVLATLSYSTTYFWRVNASNAGGASAWSPTWRFTTQSSGGDPCPSYASSMSLDEFSIEDASGNRQNFFTHNRGRALEIGVADVEVPPEPPVGAFSARLRSRNFIEGVAPNRSTVEMPVRVSGHSLPVTLSWNIKAENNIKYWLRLPGREGRRVQLTGSGRRAIPELNGEELMIEAQASTPCDPY